MDQREGLVEAALTNTARSRRERERESSGRSRLDDRRRVGLYKRSALTFP